MSPLSSLVGITSLLVLIGSDVYGQGCCTVGASSLGGLESGVRRTASLSLSISYQTNAVTQAYQGTEKIADPLRRTADVRYLTLQVEYGLMSGLSLLGSINYSDKTRELTVTTGTGSGTTDRTASFRGNGIGDLLLLAKYSVLRPTILHPTGIALGAGASLPTGSFTQEHNGAQLSIDLQPGTGAIALLGWLLVSHGLPEEGLQFVLSSTYRYAGGNFDGYRLGDEILATLIAEKSIAESYGVFLALRARFAQRDFANRRFLTGTGGTYYDIIPGLGYADGPSSLRLFGQLPLYRNVRGIQVALAYSFGVTFVYEFGGDELGL